VTAGAAPDDVVTAPAAAADHDPAAAPRPTVSVIVPAYNAEPYLDAALAGIAAQTIRPDEVVVLDDASSDATVAVAKRWDDLLPLVVVERLENRGLGAARRMAIERSTGTLLALLDADDYWLPDHLEVMARAHRGPRWIVTPDHYRWVPGLALGDRPARVEQPLPAPDRQPLAIIEANFLSYGCLFRRDDYDAVGGFSEMRSSEDWDLWIRMIRNGCRVARADTVTLMYRKRPDSLSATGSCMPYDLAILEGLLADARPEERSTVVRTLRRLRARAEFLAGLADADGGDLRSARRRWARAAIGDRSLRVGAGVHGSTTLRALLCLAAPSRAQALRDSRARDISLLTKH
jgi:glycosyltransferase involved in cell wall biosynthesis